MRAWLLALALSPVPASPAPAPPGTEQDAEETDLQKWLRLAREGRANVRPQAADKLVELGREAADALVALCGQDGSGLAALGNDVVLVLGKFDDPRLRAELWRALGDPDFPWRPAAALSLARSAREDEAERVQGFLRDPIAAVRAAGVEGLEVLDQREAGTLLQRALADPDDRVRRLSAHLLHRWGECTLHWLVEDLERTDHYFAQPTGRSARYASFAILREELDETFDYSTRKDPDDPTNLAALEALRAKLAEACDEPLAPLPEIARAGHATEGDVLGLELRSCRKGEYFLRWNQADVLYVGTGNAVAIELEPGTVARLAEQAKTLFEKLAGQFWGEPGCDLEQFHWAPAALEPRDPEAKRPPRPRAFRINKGPEAVEGLRPEPLRELAVLLVATLPETGDDPRTRDLARRVRETLEVLGGSLAAADDGE